MSNIKLDLKEFKHKSSDDKSTTLQHKDGHTITLAHKGLSKDNQAQLKALAEMGKSAVKPGDKAQAVQEQQALDPNSAPQKQPVQAFGFGDMVGKVIKAADCPSCKFFLIKICDITLQQRRFLFIILPIYPSRPIQF